MKNTFRCSTVASHLTARRFLALGAALVALAAPTLLLTGCGSGGGTPSPSPSSSTGNGQTTITGRILDVNAGSVGVAGATVQFAGVSVQTDANGSFSLTIPRNTAGGSATITPPAGKMLYPYAATSAGCANTLTFAVPLAAASGLSLGNISVYSNVGPPAFPCGI